VLTLIGENVVAKDCQGKVDEVDEEVTVVVDADAVVNPWAMAIGLSAEVV
jgi:hypothetical protein